MFFDDKSWNIHIFLDMESNNDMFLYNNSLKQFRNDKYFEKYKNKPFLHHSLVANDKKHMILENIFRFFTAQDSYEHIFKSGKLAFYL